MSPHSAVIVGPDPYMGNTDFVSSAVVYGFIRHVFIMQV